MRAIIGGITGAVLVCLAACSTHYAPRGPGIYVTMDGGKLVYVRDNQRFEHGFLGRGLIAAVAPNPQAHAAAQQYRSQMKKGLFVMLGGLACGTAALVVGVTRTDDTGNIDVNEELIAVSTLCYLAMTGGTFYFADAETYRMDAINIFNDGASGGGRERDWNRPPGAPAGRGGYSLQMR